jgi:hypothetical protein
MAALSRLDRALRFATTAEPPARPRPDPGCQYRPRNREFTRCAGGGALARPDGDFKF